MSVHPSLRLSVRSVTEISKIPITINIDRIAMKCLRKVKAYLSGYTRLPGGWDLRSQPPVNLSCRIGNLMSLLVGFPNVQNVEHFGYDRDTIKPSHSPTYALFNINYIRVILLNTTLRSYITLHSLRDKIYDFLIRLIFHPLDQ